MIQVSSLEIFPKARSSLSAVLGGIAGYVCLPAECAPSDGEAPWRRGPGLGGPEAPAPADVPPPRAVT
jgi:hypothetical protein